MTGKPTEPRIAAAALKWSCPTCGATPALRCSATTHYGARVHVRLHAARLDLGHKDVRTENTARMKQAFAT